MADITAIILTKNEEKNIGACLSSIQDLVARAVLVDCGSTDRTLEIAREMGADILFHEFEYYARQFNWGLDHAGIDTEWVLRIDADERFTPELNREIEEMIRRHAGDDVGGFTMEAWLYFLGRKLTHGGSKKRKLMIFKRGVGRIEDRKRDAHTVLSSGRSVSLKQRFLHYDFKDITSYIARYNWYATREMQDYVAYLEGQSADIATDAHIQSTRKKKFGVYYRAPMFLRAWLWFVYNYVFRLGFLDGREGFIYHFFECYWYRYLVDTKIYEHQKLGTEFEKLKALGD